MSEFAVGDSVELKSSGPVMTVVAGPEGEAKHYWCTWFAGKKSERARFPAAALQKAVESE